jgi:murein DD-endopeptidase MepM/ murein hydrolase activator NlpD
VAALLLVALVGNAGCTASTAASKPKRTVLRTDDIPPPRRPPPPVVALAPAHTEPDLVDDAPVATVRAPLGPGTHRVEAGETLYRIARLNGTTPGALAELNGIAMSTPLSIGQVLIVPSAPEARAPSEPTRPAERPVATAPPPPADSPSDEEGMPPALAAAFAAMGPHGGSGDARIGPEPSRSASAPPRATPSGRVETPVLGALPPRSSARSTPPPRPVARAGTLEWPLRGVLYARFGRKGKAPHDGIDLSAPAGTPVKTAGEGKVLFAGPQQGYGLLVIVEHAHGLVSVYAHNRDLRVRTGQALREGQVIATVGESGKTSGPHLHFEVRQDGDPVDPLPLLGPPPAR